MMIEVLVVLGFAVLLDMAFGDPSNRIHPTAWLGRAIGYVIPGLKSSSAALEKIKGIILTIVLVSVTALAAHYFLSTLELLLGIIALIVASILILKSTIAIKGMENHAMAVMDSLSSGDINGARMKLSQIVGRDTSNLNEQQIISAIVESVGESTVDGITAPIFYFIFFGIPGAIAYRTINTLDSMIGYKDEYYRNIGWFAAHLDTIANYLPARITAFLMVLAARILGGDWKNSLYIMRRDSRKTPSMNGGWPMSTIAGALRVRLEKVGYYSLGEEYEPLTAAHCRKAISIMKVTTLLFSITFAVPAVVLLSLIQ